MPGFGLTGADPAGDETDPRAGEVLAAVPVWDMCRRKNRPPKRWNP